MTYDDFIENMGKRIKELREERGYSINKISKMAGMEWRQIKDIEKGRANPTLKILNRIAEALGVDMHELCKIKPIKRLKKIKVGR